MGWSGTRGPGVAGLVLLLALALALAPTSAHDVGGDLSAEGSFVLTRAGTQNDTMHDSLENLGVPVRTGDVLTFDWSVNGGAGPEVSFSIHSHAHGSDTHYEANDTDHHGTWTAPGDELYIVEWENPTNATVTVAYAFGVEFAPSNLCGLVTLAVLAAIGVGVSILIIVKRRGKESTGP